jgi:hypothetical protein
MAWAGRSGRGSCPDPICPQRGEGAALSRPLSFRALPPDDPVEGPGRGGLFVRMTPWRAPGEAGSSSG